MLGIDGELFRSQMHDLFLQVLCSPENMRDLVIVLSLILIVFAVVLSKCHGGFRTSGSLIIGLFATVFCGFALLSIASFTIIFLAKGSELVTLLTVLAGAVLSMTVPFTRMLFRSGYGTSLAAWLIAILVTLGALFAWNYLQDPGNAQELREKAEDLSKPLIKEIHDVTKH